MIVVILSNARSLESSAMITLGVLTLTILVYWIGKLLREGAINISLALAICIPLSLLLITKYFLPIATHFSLLPEMIVPLGVSYFTFKHIGYLIECKRGKFADLAFAEYVAYIFFFPMFAAGPIERLPSFLYQLRNPTFTFSTISLGIERIIIGLGFKFIIADFLLKSIMAPPQVIENMAETFRWHQALAASFFRFLYTYFDFAGYTSMVIGTGLLFGITLMENFNFPLLRPTLGDFWRNWHISLSSWARDYIYFPVMGRTRNITLALLTTFLMIGIWHGAAPGWALWGLHHGLGLTFFGYYQRWVITKNSLNFLRNSMIWRVLSIFLVWWYVSMGYALTFNIFDVHSSFMLYGKILTFGLLIQ